MNLIALTLFAAVTANVAATPDWENPAVNSRNRLTPRTYSMPLKSVEAAFTDALEPETPYKQTLNGRWKFSWAGNPALRVADFWKTDFDDSEWFSIDVPSCTEMRGFGSPGYTNQRYPHLLAWPKILDRQSGKPDYNPVASYRRSFTVPAEWKGRDVILRFDGVYSAYTVWVNGEKVGYSEDSKLPAEFDITKKIQDGTNTLAVEVFRWCDGSYLEDQDMTRFTGIFRDVTIWAMPQAGIWDFSVLATPDGNLSVDCPGAEWKLYDAKFKEVSVPVKGVHLWSAEDPYLYTLVLTKGDDIRMRRVGFKDQKIVGGVFQVNGVPVKFKGVNRHETNPENGRAVSLKDMVTDVELMKKYNVNTVRTCHYPDHRLWYDLCDRYGIYLVAEANVEAHEPGYGEKGLGRIQEWNHSIVQRNERNVIFYRNHPSVTMWSLGNETGHGLCFSNAAARVRQLDPSRPVHWERGNEVGDVDSTMYAKVPWVELRGKFGRQNLSAEEADTIKKELVRVDGRGQDHTAGKCFFMCEYAHSMGNALGDFADYWDVFYRYDALAGGCIWDWVDQAVWKSTGEIDRKTGRAERYLAYGGDFDEEPNDGPFNCNGVVDPLRRVSAKLVEVGHVHRNLVVTRSSAATDNGYATVFELWNRFSFTSADAFAGRWSLLADGKTVASGTFDTPALKPSARCRFTVSGLAEALASTSVGSELFVNFSFSLKKDERWAKAGYVIARDQVRLSKDEWKPVARQPGIAGGQLEIREDDKSVTVLAGSVKAVFCRRSGTLCELVKNGRTVVKDPAPGVVYGPRFTCARAFTDNDRWLRESFLASGLSQLRYHARPIRVEGNVVKTTVEVTGSKSAGFTHVANWTFRTDGTIAVENSVTPHGTMPTGGIWGNDAVLPRVGLSLRLAKGFEKLSYYGRGPMENYIDRKSGSFFGLWTSTVTDEYEPYVRPQDCGSKSDVRWVAFTDGKCTVRFSASEPMYVQALHYSCEDLDRARHRPHEPRTRTPLAKRDEVCLNLDIRQFGLGGASCGPVTQPKYRFKVEPWSWTLLID